MLHGVVAGFLHVVHASGLELADSQVFRLKQIKAHFNAPVDLALLKLHIYRAEWTGGLPPANRASRTFPIIDERPRNPHGKGTAAQVRNFFDFGS